MTSTATPKDLSVIISSSGPHDLIGLLLPIITIVMGFGIGMLALWLDYRKKRDIFQLHHAERMAAIEKGIEVPPLPPEFFQATRPRPPPDMLRRGLLWLLLGASGAAAMYESGAREQAWWGLVLFAWGIADLLFYALDRRRHRSAASNTGAQH
jgi:hypothetical protein